MIPVFALVGRPNVGKSTLFNRLTKSQNALVADIPGLTRDRIYGRGKLGDRPYIVIDTGGIAGQEAGIELVMVEQTRAAIEEADAIFFLVDAKGGVIGGDYSFAEQLRALGKPVYLLVNKTDGEDEDIVCADFYQLGLSEPVPIAAAHNRGVNQFIQRVLDNYPQPVTDEEVTEDSGVRVALIGRPNVGKSTLVNRLLGENRVVVYDEPGTTRDSIAIEMTRNEKQYVLVDTAGVRRRGKITEVVEKFSVVKTLQSIEEAHVIVMLIDAVSGLSLQDIHIIGMALNAGKAMVLAINKWDGMTKDARDDLKNDLDRRLDFIPYVEKRFISALHGTGVGHLFTHIDKAFRSATRKIPTSKLTDMLERAVEAHPPPLIRGRRIKLRYAHLGGNMPPRIVVHGNQVESVPDSYKRYLTNHFREAFKLVGTPLLVEFKGGENPYAGIKNELTERQKRKRKRMKKFLKKKAK